MSALQVKRRRILLTDDENSLAEKDIEYICSLILNQSMYFMNESMTSW